MNRTGCGLITITLIHLPGITGITTTSGLGTAHGTGHHGTIVLTGMTHGIGTTHTGGITDTTPTAPVAAAIGLLYRDPRTGIRAIQNRGSAPDRMETIDRVAAKADVLQATTAHQTTGLLSIHPLVGKVTTAVLRAIRLLPDSNNPVRDHPPTGTGVIRLLPGSSNPVRDRRPTDSVRAMKTYGEGRRPAGVLLQARKESSTEPRKAVRPRRAVAAGATTMVRPPEVIAIPPRPAATGVTIIPPLRGAILLPIPAAVTRLRAAATLPRVLPGLRPPLHPEERRPADTAGDKTSGQT